MKMLSLINYKPYVLKAIDNHANILDDTLASTHKQLLPETIVLEKGILVKLITGNLLIQDGLRIMVSLCIIHMESWNFYGYILEMNQ